MVLVEVEEVEVECDVVVEILVEVDEVEVE